MHVQKVKNFQGSHM